MTRPGVIAGARRRSGGSSYVAKAVHFDGSTTLFNPAFDGGDPNTYNVNRLGSVSYVVWLKNFVFPPLAGTITGFGVLSVPLWVQDPVMTYDLSSAIIYTSFGHYAQLGLASNGLNDGFLGQADSSTIAAGFPEWTCLMVSGDANQPAGLHALQFYLGDTALTTSFTPDADEIAGEDPVYEQGPLQLAAPFSTYPFSFGTDFYPTNVWKSDMADFRMWVGSKIDFSIEANRRLFIDASGKPVDPSGARTAFGTPMLELSGDANSFASNTNGGGGILNATKCLFADGRNGAGSILLPGAKAGDTVVHVIWKNNDTYQDSDFETTISIDDHIQQLSTDLSANTGADQLCFLLSGTLTNASTSPSD
jgi:hypothetical protein